MPQVLYQVTEPAGAAAIVEHAPHAFIGKAPGRFQAVGTCGPRLRSDVVDLEIREPVDVSGLAAMPSAITVRVGERTPAIRVETLPRPADGSRFVDAQWSSEDEAVAAPIRKVPDGSSAVRPARRGSARRGTSWRPLSP